MKKMMMLGLGLLLSGIVFGQEEEKVEGYLIQGTISGDYKGKVYLTHEDGIHGNQTNIDSCEVVDGKYTFKGPQVDVVTMHFIKSQDGQLTPVFLENGTIQISGRADNFLWANVSGTRNNELLAFYRMRERFVTDSMIFEARIYWDKYGWDMKREETEFKRRTDLGNRRKLEIQRDLVTRFNDEAFAPFMIRWEMVADLSIDELKALRAQLDPVLSGHPYVKDLDEYIEQQDFKVGSTAFQFKLPGMDGNQIALKNYTGKYVLLDFWASWCGPCRREMPNVVKLYKQCKGKNFEIIGISLDHKESDWKKAVKEMHMTWSQACDLQVWQSQVMKRYNVQAIPRTILIDPQGKVVAIDLRGEELIAKVKEVLKKK